MRDEESGTGNQKPEHKHQNNLIPPAISKITQQPVRFALIRHEPIEEHTAQHAYPRHQEEVVADYIAFLK